MSVKFVSNSQFVDLKHPNHPTSPVRIDWIGNPQNQVDSDGLPAFKVPILISVLKRNNQTNNKWDVDKNIEQKVIWCSADSLPILSIDSVWVNGQQRPYSNRSTAKVLKFLKAKDFISIASQINLGMYGKSSYPIPYHSFFISKKHNWSLVKSSTLLACQVIDSEGEISEAYIPSIELARFYACPTSLLARSLFAGEWQKLEWQAGSSEIVNENGEYITIIGQNTILGLCHKSAAYQARFKHSNQMCKWVNSAGTYLQNNTINPAASRASNDTDNNYNFKFGFPFVVDDLQPYIECDVVELNYSQNPDVKTYLVTRIRKCNVPFAPHDRIEANPILNSEKAKNEQPEQYKPMFITRRNPDGEGPISHGTIGDSVDFNLVTHTSPSTPNKGMNEIAIDNDIRSDWLTEHPVKQSSKTTQKYFHQKTTITKPGNRGEIESLNPGRGYQTGEIETQLQLPDDTQTEASTIDTFLDAVSYLQSLDVNSEPTTKTLTKCSTDLAEIIVQKRYRQQNIISLLAQGFTSSRWQYMFRFSPTNEVQKKSQRHVAFAIFEFSNGENYLIGEIERRNTEKFCMFVCNLNQTDIQIPEFLNDLLLEIIRRQQWPEWNSQTKEWIIGSESYQGKRLLHTWKIDDAVHCAKNILRLL